MTVRRGIGEWQPGIVAGRTCRAAGADPDPLCGESSAAKRAIAFMDFIAEVFSTVRALNAHIRKRAE